MGDARDDVPRSDPPARPRRLAVVRVVLVVAVVALCAALARRLDLDRLLEALRHADWRLVALAALTNLTINTAARVGRWRALLDPLPRTGPPPTFAELASLYVAAQAASNLLPARAGEAVRAVQLHRRNGYTVSGLVTVQLVETLVGAVTLGALTLPMVPLGHAPTSLSAGIFVFALAGPLGMIALLVIARVVRVPAAPPPPPPGFSVARIAALARGMLVRLLEAVQHLGSITVWARSLAWSLLSDFSDVLMIVLVLQAVGATLPLASCVIVYAAINLVLLAPTTPAQIGVLEVGAVAALRAFGVEENTALAFALLYHAAHVVPPTVVGGALMFRLDLRRGEAAQRHGS